MTQMYSSNYYQLPTERVSNHTHHLDQGIFFCLFCQFLYIFFNHIFSKCLIDYYILISMKIMLEKAPKTLNRLSDPGPIEKSPLCPGGQMGGFVWVLINDMKTYSKKWCFGWNSRWEPQVIRQTRHDIFQPFDIRLVVE